MQSRLVIGFSDIRKSTGDILLKILLLNVMGSKINLRESDWKQPIFWEKLSTLNLGQDIDYPHHFLTRLLSFADPIAIVSPGECKFTMDRTFLTKTSAHIILNGHMQMEQEDKKSKHTQHIWILSPHQRILNATSALSRAQGRCNDKLSSSNPVSIVSIFCLWGYGSCHSSDYDFSEEMYKALLLLIHVWVFPKRLRST